MVKSIIVNKFGGGILKKNLIPSIPKRLKEQINKGFKPIVVVSALPGVTDELLSLITSIKDNFKKELITVFLEKLKNKHLVTITDFDLDKNLANQAEQEIKNCLGNLKNDLEKIEKIDNQTEDKIVSYGERLSAILVSFYLKKKIGEINVLLAENIPIVTDDNFKNADIDFEISKNNLIGKISKLKGVIVISGFTGKTKQGQITTLGRGGTDTTACFVGSALKAEKIILWKDVGGVLSADPKIIKKAKTIPSINYFEAEEAGKIIHDKAIQYIKIDNTKIEISSIINPKEKTAIEKSNKISKGAKLISTKKDLTFILITDENIKLNDLILLVSQIFHKYKLDITLISNSKYSLQIISDNKNDQLQKACDEIKDKVEKIEITHSTMIFAIGLFDAKDVSNFNDILIKNGSDLLISAFYYENCHRMEAIIKTSNINKVVKAVYKKFIK